MARNKPKQSKKRRSSPAKGGGSAAKYVLRLYVTGTTPRATSAITHIKQICEERLKGRYTLEVIDIYQQPGFAKEEQIIAAPTLIKELPDPLRRLVGDLSDKHRVLAGLGLSEANSGNDSKS